MMLTQEQRNILGRARTPGQSIIVNALAGTGKTFTLIEVLKMLPEASTLVLAFNARIAQEFERRKPPLPRHRLVHVRTLHAAGFWMTRHHFPRVKVDREITERRIRAAAGDGAPLRVLGASTKLLRLCKDLQHERTLNLDDAYSIGVDFDCFGKLASVHECQDVVEIVGRAYAESLNVEDVIDFPDQGWLPLVLGLDPPSRYKVILLDEYQDVNANQLAMAERLLAPNGRIISAGDLHQQIYSWRGAVGKDVQQQLIDKHKAISMPLTCTWRCDRSIVTEANQLVPALRPRPDAGMGRVARMPEAVFYESIGAGEEAASTFVLSRTNAELLRVALEMWRRKIPFNIAQSTDILQPIKAVLTRLLRFGAKPEPKVNLTKGVDEDTTIDQALSLFHMRRQQGDAQAQIARKFVMGRADESPPAVERFKQQLGAWYMTEMMKAQNAGSVSMADRIDDQYRTILYCMNYVRDPREIEGLLESIYLVDETCWITLSTVHKAKGLEADHVYLLRETFQRHQKRKDLNGNAIEVPIEELNVEYVAITRAKRTLTWVSMTERPEA